MSSTTTAIPRHDPFACPRLKPEVIATWPKASEIGDYMYISTLILQTSYLCKLVNITGLSLLNNFHWCRLRVRYYIKTFQTIHVSSWFNRHHGNYSLIYREVPSSFTFESRCAFLNFFIHSYISKTWSNCSGWRARNMSTRTLIVSWLIVIVKIIPTYSQSLEELLCSPLSVLE